MIRDYLMMYEVFQRHGMVATAELREAEEILGRERRAYADFVRESCGSVPVTAA